MRRLIKNIFFGSRPLNASSSIAFRPSPSLGELKGNFWRFWLLSTAASEESGKSFHCYF